MNETKEIKLPKGVDRIAVMQHDDKVVIEFIVEKPKFKNGDFVYEDEGIMIVKSYPNEFHAVVWTIGSGKPKYNGTCGLDFSEPTFRHASDVEKQILIDAMKKDGKRWNAERMEIEDILKKGDLAIFWNEETLPDEDAIIARYNCADIIDLVTSHHSADGGVYNFAVKWDGTKEQFEKVLRGEI